MGPWTSFVKRLEQDTNLSKIGDRRGYIRIFVPYHPRANRGYVLEHRLVAELMIGCFLPRGIVVHHINEIKTDNRSENLYLTTVSEHTVIHKTGETRSMLESSRHRKSIRVKRKHSKPRQRDLGGKFVSKDYKGPVQKRLASQKKRSMGR